MRGKLIAGFGGNSFRGVGEGNMIDKQKLIASVALMTDADRLRNLMKNAKKRGEKDVEHAAFLRLVAVQPQEKPGSVEHSFWMTIYAFEEILREERGKTVRLSRTRQKIARVGERQTLIDFALDSSPTDGFKMLIERNLPQLTGEAIVLKHSGEFDPKIVDAARKRLEDAQVDLSTIGISS